MFCVLLGGFRLHGGAIRPDEQCGERADTCCHGLHGVQFGGGAAHRVQPRHRFENLEIGCVHDAMLSEERWGSNHVGRVPGGIENAASPKTGGAFSGGLAGEVAEGGRAFAAGPADQELDCFDPPRGLWEGEGLGGADLPAADC